MRSAALRSKGDALTNAPTYLSSASATVANTSGLGSLASRATPATPNEPSRDSLLVPLVQVAHPTLETDATGLTVQNPSFWGKSRAFG